MSATLKNKGIGTEAVFAPGKQSWDPGSSQLAANYFAATQKDPFAIMYSKVVRNDVKKRFNETKSKRYLLDLGDYHVLNKAYARAEQAYREASTDEKYVLQATRKLINVSILQQDIDKTIGYFDKLIYESDNNTNYLIEKISFLLNNYAPRLNSKLERAFQTAFNIDHNNPELFNLSGIFHLVKNEIEAADTDFRKVLTLDRRNIHATNNIGVIYSLRNLLEKAKLQYRKALDINAHYSTGYENLAALFMRQEKLNDALAVLNLARERKVAISEDWDHNYGYLLLQTSNLSEAVTWYRNKIEQEPTNNLLFSNLGKCYESQGHRGQARKYYEKATVIAKSKLENSLPFDGRIWASFYNLMHMYHEVGEYNKLENLVSYVEQYLPKDWKNLYYKALVKIDKYEYATAEKILDEVLLLNPTSVDAKINLSFLLAVVKKDFEAAILLLKPVVKEHGHTIIVDNNLIYAYLKSSNLGEAKKLLDLYETDQLMPYLMASRGLYYFNTESPDKADQAFRQATKLFKGKMKKVATQVWLNEKSEYLFGHGRFKEALTTVNEALSVFKEGYSYSDALSLKEKILNS